MIEVSGGQDQLLDMFDKLQVVNLSTEGAAILESMADLIRCALEKGLLLEQNILKERNNKLENNLKNKSPIKVSKKKMKSQKVSIDNNISEENKEKGINCSDNAGQDVDNCSSILSVSPAAYNLQGTNVTINNKPGTSEYNMPISTNISGSKIKLINPSLLVNQDLNLPVSRTKSAGDPSFISSSSGTPVYCSPGLILPNHLPVFDRNQITGPLLNQGAGPFLTSGAGQITPSESAEYGGLKAKEEQQKAIFTNESCSANLPSENSVGTVTNAATTLNESTSNPSSHCNSSLINFGPPVMPTPIFIKCELNREDKNIELDQYIPFDMQLNVTSQTMRSSPGVEQDSFLSEINHTNSSDINQSAEDKNSDLHQVYITAGKDATEEELNKLFEQEELVVTKIKLINKPSHSFGFISFQSEQDMKRAMSLNYKLSAGGDPMAIRHCFKERVKSSASNQKKENVPTEKQKSNDSFGENASKKQKLSDNSPSGKNEGQCSLNTSFAEMSASPCDNPLADRQFQTNENYSFPGSSDRSRGSHSFSEFSRGRDYRYKPPNSKYSRPYNKPRGGLSRPHQEYRQGHVSYNQTSNTSHHQRSSGTNRPGSFNDGPPQKRLCNHSHDSNMANRRVRGQGYDQVYRSKHKIVNQRRRFHPI